MRSSGGIMPAGSGGIPAARRELSGIMPLTNNTVVAVVALRQPRLRGAGGTPRRGRTIHAQGLRRCTRR
jgi:hypothetical protein